MHCFSESHVPSAPVFAIILAPRHCLNLSSTAVQRHLFNCYIETHLANCNLNVNRASPEGQVPIRRRDGQTFVVRPTVDASSPLDVPGVDSDLSREQVVALVSGHRAMWLSATSNCLEELDTESGPLVLIPEGRFIEFSGGFGFSAKRSDHRPASRRAMRSRTSSHGSPEDSPASTRRARLSISFAQEACTF